MSKGYAALLPALSVVGGTTHPERALRSAWGEAFTECP